MRDKRISRYAVRLVVSGTEVPITDFSFSEPVDRLGAVLQATLAKPLPQNITGESTITFQIGVWVASAWIWVTLISDARLGDLSHALASVGGAPVDRVNFSTTDALGERTNRAPSRPVTLYDPAIVSVDAERENSSLEDLRFTSGASVRTDYRAVAGLSLHGVLRALYVTGCGFPVLYTNLPNYPVDRVDVSLEAGYDAAARGLINAFAPLIYTDAAGALWIIDTALAPPNGSPLPRTLTLSSVRAMEDSVGAGQISDRIIVSYRVRAQAGEYFTERLEQEHSESGSFGAAGFTETEVARRVREYRRLAEPGTVTRTVVVSTTTTVRGREGITTRSSQQDQFDGAGRKSGHTRAIESLVPQLPSGDLLLQTVQEEKQSITYRPNPKRPRESVIAGTVTYLAGRVLEDSDNTYRDKPFKIPLTDAHRNGFVDKDADQKSVFQAIRTTTESFRESGDGGVELSTIVTDHLNNTIERSSSQTRAGSLSLGGGATGRGSRRVLLNVAADFTLNPPGGRKVPAFDAGDVPDQIARAMGVRQLARLQSPPRTARVELPAPDLTLHRGSRVSLPSRDGSLGTFIIAGQTIAGRIENAALVITHSFEARESK